MLMTQGPCRARGLGSGSLIPEGPCEVQEFTTALDLPCW